MASKHFLYAAFAACSVVFLWSLALVIPAYLGLEDSGRMGDTFGSVNALFSGLGFVALTITILMQLTTTNEQQKQQRFTTGLKIVDDIKDDLNRLVLPDMDGPYPISTTGVTAITSLMKVISLRPIELDMTPYAETITIVTCAVDEINSLRKYVHKHLKVSEEGDILENKIAMILLTYFLQLRIVLNMANNKNEKINILREELNKLSLLVFPELK